MSTAPAPSPDQSDKVEAVRSNNRPVTRMDRVLTYFGVGRDRDDHAQHVFSLDLAPFMQLRRGAPVRSVTNLILAGLLAACATVERSEPSPEAPPELSAPSLQGARRSPFNEPPGVYSVEVTQANIGTTICVSGWTTTVRPSTSFTQPLKKAMMVRAGLESADATKYELDHFVPLALGGHPRSEDNLWLQPWDGDWNARVKDRLERTLQVMVCAGKLTLGAARTAIQSGWRAAYRKYVAAEPTAVHRQVEMEDEVGVE